MKRTTNLIVIFLILAVISYGLMIYTGFNFDMISMNRYLLLFAIFGTAISLLIACFTTKKDLEETKIGVIVPLVLVLWLFMTFIGLIFNTMIEGRIGQLGLVLFAQLMMMFGVTISKGSGYGWILVFVGVTISTFIVVFNSVSLEQQLFMWKTLIPILLMTSYPIIGAIWMANTLLYRNKMLRKCTLEIEGMCIKLKKKFGKRISYSPIYEYYVDGQKYIYDKCPYTNFSVPEIGDKEIIYVNPDNHSEAYRKDPLGVKIISGVLWFNFIVLGIVGLIIAVKELIFL